jgi:hypothetical protein
MEESNEPIANEQFQKDSERFTRLVTFSPDPLVLILKGHLLIEEQLNKFLVTGTSKPETLIDARLSFHQTLRIAQAIGGALFSDELVLLIEKLNALRNRLAHMAEPQGIDDKLHEFELSGLTLFPGTSENSGRTCTALRSPTRYVRISSRSSSGVSDHATVQCLTTSG